jgi:hypothetical protein
VSVYESDRPRDFNDSEQFLRDHVAFVMRVMQRSLMGNGVERVTVEHWIELLRKSLDGEPFA